MGFSRQEYWNGLPFLPSGDLPHLGIEPGSLVPSVFAGRFFTIGGGRRRRGTTEDEMVGWHQRLNGHEFEQAPKVSDGQGSLACCSPWGHKELDTIEQLN